MHTENVNGGTLMPKPTLSVCFCPILPSVGNCWHKNKSKGWLFKKYWTASGQKHIFAVKAKTKKKVDKVYQIVRMCSIGIRRFIKIKAAANPYLPEFAKYFWERRTNKESKLLPAMSARQYRAMIA